MLVGRKGYERCGDELRRRSLPEPRAVFPVGIDGVGEIGEDELICTPCNDGEEQVANPGLLPTVYQPTRSEFLDHCISHFPFRVWCRHCVEGRGREFGHSNSQGEKDERSTPVVSFDYAFISDAGDVFTDEDFIAAGEGAAKLLIVRDSRSKAVFAHVVPAKGIDERGFAVDALVSDILWTGYARVTLKSDNEPAIVKLLKEALRELRISGLEQVLEEHPPEYDPQSNGSAEVGVKLVKGLFRTLRSDLESKIGHRVPVRHPLISWMIRHAADLVTWCSKGHDGRTAHQRLRGRDFKTRLLGFGELCRFKNRSHEQSAGNSVWHTGIFVGIDQRTGQYMLFADDGVKLARTITRVPESEKFDKDMLAGVNATPYDLHQPRKPEVVFKEKIDAGTDEFVDKKLIARQVYLRASDFTEHGMTRGCVKCDHFIKYSSWGTAPHSKVCRDRITAKLMETEAGRIRIGAAVERLDKTVEHLGQQFREDQPQGEKADVRQDLPEMIVPQFVPIESRVVLPPADEPGKGETRVREVGDDVEH